MTRLAAAALSLACLVLAAPGVRADGLPLERTPGSLRIATFNADMARKGAGVLLQELQAPTDQIRAVAEIVLRVRPDILLVNEIDHDPDGAAARRLAALLARGLDGLDGWDMPHGFTAPANTGVPSGLDLDGDGKVMGPRDALGYGRFPGQYGMAVLSRFPIARARTFQHLRWSGIPWAEAPVNPDGTAYYSEAAWARLPMSSKSHWDVVVTTPEGPLHVLASHPTPPVFDGPEDYNGLRNAAEIRFWVDYIDGADWIVDDMGGAGGLPDGAAFVVVGDLNADPAKGEGRLAAIRALIAHPRVQDPGPKSPGAAVLGDARDTADWPEKGGPGNLRVDYALPAAGLQVTGAGVFWPAPDDPLYRLVAIRGRDRASSDHRLVWVDVRLPGQDRE